MIGAHTARALVDLGHEVALTTADDQVSRSSRSGRRYQFVRPSCAAEGCSLIGNDHKPHKRACVARCMRAMHESDA
jgi:hypothetical protein